MLTIYYSKGESRGAGGARGSSQSPENKMSEKVIYSLVDKNHKSCVESGPLHNLFCDPPMGFVGKL